MGTFVQMAKTRRYSTDNDMEFGILMTDIQSFVAYKFEMYIFVIALVTKVSIQVCTEYTFVKTIQSVLFYFDLAYIFSIRVLLSSYTK